MNKYSSKFLEKESSLNRTYTYFITNHDFLHPHLLDASSFECDPEGQELSVLLFVTLCTAVVECVLLSALFGGDTEELLDCAAQGLGLGERSIVLCTGFDVRVPRRRGALVHCPGLRVLGRVVPRLGAGADAVCNVAECHARR